MTYTVNFGNNVNRYLLPTNIMSMGIKVISLHTKKQKTLDHLVIYYALFSNILNLWLIFIMHSVGKQRQLQIKPKIYYLHLL